MNKSKKLLLFTFLCICFFSLPAYSKAPENNNNPYIYDSFNLNIKQLPANFKGVNPKELYEFLKNLKAVASKNEFETTLEYRKRIAKLASEPFIGNLYFNSLFAFSGKLKFLTTQNIIYNADDKTATISIELIKNIKKETGYDSSKRGFILDSNMDISYYNASNSYGAEVVVEKSKEHNHTLDILNWEDFANSPRSLTSLIINKVSMPIDTVKEIKSHDFFNPSLACLFIGKLGGSGEPAWFFGYEHFQPTVDDPKEYYLYDNFISMTVKEIWIYDVSSGTIISKIKPKN